MANTLKFGNENWATKKDSILAYNDENANFKPLPFVTSRASTATRVNKAGLLETVASGVPRVDYLDNSKGSYLLEPASTNLITQSEAFGNSYWTKSNASIEGDASTAGSEQVVNGDFATDTGWTKQTGWTISGGGANYDFLSNVKYIRQTLLNGGIVSGNTYQINFEITSGTAYISINSNSGVLVSSNTYSVGSYSLSINASVSGSDLLIYGRNTQGTAFSIDNVSVKEVQGFASPSADTPLGALKLVEDTSTSTHKNRAINALSSATNYTMSVVAKKGERNWLSLNDVSASTVYFDLENGVVGSTVIGTPTYGIESLSDGWYRCWMNATTSASGHFGIYLAESDGVSSYTGDGTSGVYIFGAQLEQKSYATSYIKTSGSTVTRLAESCSQTPPDGVIGQTEGTMFIDVTGETQVDAARYITIGNIGDTTNRLIIYQYSNLINVFSGAGATFNITYNPPSGRLKMALAYSVGDYAFYVNGVQVFTNDNNAVPACSEVSLGMNEITSAILAPSIGYNDVGLYNTRLSNTELVTLTTI